MPDYLDHLELDPPHFVSLRAGRSDSPTPGSTSEPFAVAALLRQEGLIKHLGLCTVSAEQIAEAQSIAPSLCGQNFHNIASPTCPISRSTGTRHADYGDFAGRTLVRPGHAPLDRRMRWASRPP